MNEQQKTMLEQQMRLKRGAAIIEGTQDAFRQDGYSNLLNKYGTKQDNSTAYRYNQEMVTTDMELVRLYEGNGLFTKIIDRPSEEAVKHGLDIDYGDEDISEYVEDRLDELDYEEKFATAEKWARLYGGSIIVMLVDDGRGLEEPLDWNNARSIEELHVFERSVVQPDYTTMNMFHFADSLGRKKHLREPEWYQVFSMYGYFRVHRSRCLVFRNGRLPEQTTNEQYRYWGIPEYVKIKRALRECITSHEDGVKLLERSVQAIYKMKNLSNMLATTDGEDKVLQRLQVIDMARGLLNSIAIDNDGEDYDFKTQSMAGVKEVIDTTCNMLSAVTDIPQTILFGRSPAGMNATGESDLENYYNMVENIQKKNMKANTRTVIDLILKQGAIEGEIPKVPKYKVKFAALWSMSDKEQTDVDKVKADTEYVKAQTAQLYMDSSVLDPSEVRRSLASEGNFEIEEVLTDNELDLPEDTFDLGIDTPITISGINDIGTDEEDTIISLDIEAENDNAEKPVITIRTDGGPGSGNWGHSGRPGKLGGSNGGGGKANRTGTKETGFSSEAKERKNTQSGSGTRSKGNSKESKPASEKKPKSESKAEAKTKNTPAKKYTKKELEAMPLSKLKKLALEATTEYYKSGKSGISFGKTPPEQAAAMLVSIGSKTSLVKDIYSIQKKMGNTDSEEDYPAAAVLVIKEGKILCASRSKGEGICGPGGKVEDWETPEEAAIREAQEEFNITPLNLIPLGEYKASSDSYMDSKLYFTDEYTGTPEADGDEMISEQWLSMEELRSKLLFPPFEYSLNKLSELLKNHLTNKASVDTLTSENTDGGPGSGRYPKGSGKKNQKKKSLPMTAKEKAKVTHDINNLYHSKYQGKKYCMIRTHSNEKDSPSYVYRFENNGFDNYNIYHKGSNE